MSEGAGSSSWLPPESSNADELADERTRAMAAAATASRRPTDAIADGASWLPADDPPASPGEGSTSWMPPEPPPASESDHLGQRDERHRLAPAALTADRRQALAVEAYCRELCPTETASAAAAEALRSSGATSDAELLRHTRSVAAGHAFPPPRRGRRRSIPPECEATPPRLAGRANDDLNPEEREALERHLDSCINCQATELRARRAERAFAGIAGIALAAGEPSPKPEPKAAAEAPAPAQWAALATSAAVPAPFEQTSETGAPPVAVPEVPAPFEPAVDGARSDWIAPAAPALAPLAAGETDAPSPSVGTRRRRRPPLAGALAGTAAVAVAAVIAVVALSGGHSHNNAAVAKATTPARTASTTPAPAHHKAAARRPAKKHHAVAKKPALHHSAPASSSAPAVASATPTSTPSSSAAASSSSAASSSAASSPAASSPAASSQPSTPSVSISQPGLGNAPASQGIGK